MNGDPTCRDCDTPLVDIDMAEDFDNPAIRWGVGRCPQCDVATIDPSVAELARFLDLQAEQAAALAVTEDEIAAQAELIAQDDALNEVLDTESTVCFNGDMDTNTNNTPTLTRQNDDLELALDLWEDGAADLDHEILIVIEDSDGERVGNLDDWAKYLGFEMVEEDHNTTWWVKFTSEERTATALTHFLHGNSTATWTHNPSGTTLAAIDWRLQ